MSQLGLGGTVTGEQRIRRRERLRAAAAVLTAVLVLVGMLGVAYTGASGLLSGLRSSTAPPPADYAGPGDGEVVVEVKKGETAREIGKRLEQADVVASAAAFSAAAQADPERANGLQPGRYRLRHGMSGAQAFEELLDPGSRAVKRVTVPEGLRLEETVEVLAKGTGIPAADYRRALRSPALGLPPYARGPEGFLFPATYEIPQDAGALDVLKMMVKRFEQAAQQAKLDRGGRRTPYEIVIIASLVEGEARRAEDFGKVARVVVNRLDRRIALGLDSTVNYVLKTSKQAPTTQDIAVDSPYNTYRHAGLPPGPINSPGDRALAVARKPPPGTWLYFVTTDPESGETKFTASYSQFLRFKREYQRSARRG